MRGKQALHAFGVRARFGIDVHTGATGLQAHIHNALDAVLLQESQEVLRGAAPLADGKNTHLSLRSKGLTVKIVDQLNGTTKRM